MGGYNTLAEAVSKGMPTVCVPRISPRSEQLMRAQAFERLGLVKTLEPEKLSAETLRQTLEAALRIPRKQLLDCGRDTIRFDGALQAARYLLGLATSKRLTPKALAGTLEA
jgi:predicted glycosyltransferase